MRWVESFPDILSNREACSRFMFVRVRVCVCARAYFPGCYRSCEVVATSQVSGGSSSAMHGLRLIVVEELFSSISKVWK